MHAVVGIVQMVTGKPLAGYHFDGIRLACPLRRDPATGFRVPEANCTLPPVEGAMLANGSTAVRKFQDEYGLRPGDKISVSAIITL